MKFLFKMLVALIVANIFMLAMKARCDTSLSTISWKQHPEVAAISLTLKDGFVLIRIKNESKNHIGLLHQDPNILIKLFYIDNRGTLIPLGDHPFYNDLRDLQEEGEIWTEISTNSKPLSVAMTPEELVQIKTHPVICRIVIYDPKTKQKYHIESSPRLLTDTK